MVELDDVSQKPGSDVDVAEHNRRDGSRRLHGVLKSYNPGKGYGFVACEDIAKHFQRDCFIHRNEVESAGLKVNDKLSFEIKLNSNGQPQAEDVLSEEPMQEEEGEKRDETPAAEAQPNGGLLGHGEEEPPPEDIFIDGLRRFNGVLKSYFPAKGFGFVSSEEVYKRFKRDTFIHRNEVEWARITVGDEVTFTVRLNQNSQPQATDVNRVAGEDGMGPLGQDDGPDGRERIEGDGLTDLMPPACFEFSKDGKCSFGSRCKFRHDTATAGGSPGAPPNRRALRGACVFFLSGHCKHGNACRKRHPDPDEAQQIRDVLRTMPCRDGLSCSLWNCLYDHRPEGEREGDALPSCPPAGPVAEAAADTRQEEEEAASADSLAKSSLPVGAGPPPGLEELQQKAVCQQSTVSSAAGTTQSPAGFEEDESTTGTAEQQRDEEIAEDWQVYTTPCGQKWWWCESTEDWFLENDPGPWQKFIDPSSERSYWWKSDDNWFWVH